MLQQEETTKVHIRQVTADDIKYAESIASTINLAFRTINVAIQKSSSTPTESDAKGDRLTVQDIEDLFHRIGDSDKEKGSPILICAFEQQQGKKDKVVVGTIALEPDGDDSTYLSLFYVHPRYHNKGLGVQLIYSALLFAKKLGYKTLLAEMYETETRLLNWYKQYGAYVIETQNTHIPDHIRREGIKVITVRKDLEEVPILKRDQLFIKASL